jgi:hypothetical protein
VANTNTLTYVIPQLLAQGLLALRQMAVMPRYINRGYETLAGDKGSTIDVPIPSAITAVEVTPSYVPPDDAGVSPTKVSIAVDQWWEAPFFLSDQDMLQAMDGVIPMQASEAVKSLANKVDALILALYKDVYGYVGSAGSTPFATGVDEMLSAMGVLDDQLAPTDPRFVALNSRAKANALGLRQFSDVGWRGDNAGIIRGEIGDKFGATWFMDQNMPRHTAGTGVGYTVNGAHASTGVKTVAVTGGALGTLLAGDIVSFAGSDQTYVLTANGTGTGTVTSIAIEPGLQVALLGSELITKRASHRVNLAFHRDAFTLASRPFSGADPLGLGTYQSAVDPVSGLAMRLEVSRQHKRTRFSFDILCGVKTTRRDLACRIAGE